MKFAVLQDRLKEALSIVTKAVDSRPTLPILANVLIRTADGRIEIIGSNLGHTISVFVGAKVDVPGVVTLPARTLSELVGNLAPERIDVSLNEGTQTVTLKCGGAKSSIKGMNAVEYPPMPQPESWDLELSAEQVGKMLRVAVVCAAKDFARPILTGMYMCLENGRLDMASADGYRLAHVRTELESDRSFKVVIPAEPLKAFMKLLGDDGAVQLAFTENAAFLRFQSVTVSVQLLEGKFPDFESIIPYHWNTRVTCYTADLLRACKRAEIFGRDNNNSIRFLVKPASSANEPGTLMLVGRSAERGDIEGEVDAHVEGAALEAAYNVRYLMDILSAIDTERVVFDTDGASHPCTLAPEDANGAQQFLVMPMSVNS